MTEKFLDRVYDARDAASTRALYDQWAASYESEVGKQGYATPGRCAAALAMHMDDKTAPILDFGCGTGLSGLAFKLAGFAVIDGLDLSDDMLKFARDKSIYRQLRQVEPGMDLEHRPGQYAAIAAIGVIGAGAAPISLFDVLMDGLAPSGRLVFSFNDHALADPMNQGKVDGTIESGQARLLHSEYGPHLPGIGMQSRVYVLEKL